MAATIRRLWPAFLAVATMLAAVITVLVVTGGTTPAPAVFAISATPKSEEISRGATGTFQVTVTSHSGFGGTVVLKAVDFGIGTHPSLSSTMLAVSTSQPSASTSLSVEVDPEAPLGNHSGRIEATNILGNRSVAVAFAVVSSPTNQGTPFQITTVALKPLSPGIRQPIDLIINNPGLGSLSVGELTVQLRSISAAGCGLENFSVEQYRGPPLTVPAGASITLDSLGIDRGAWPVIAMLDLPINQDACKGASIVLSYLGTGTGV